MGAKERLWIKDKKRREIIFKTSDRIIPGLEIQGYGCELCEDFRQPSSLPFHKALANQGAHNKLKHQTGQAPRIMFLYKA